MIIMRYSKSLIISVFMKAVDIVSNGATMPILQPGTTSAAVTLVQSQALAVGVYGEHCNEQAVRSSVQKWQLVVLPNGRSVMEE